jgi:hypothetical protein
MTLLKGLVIWLIIIVAETLHGAARMVLLEPYAGDFRARQISVFTGSVIILAIAFAFVRWLRAGSVFQLLGVGLLWLGLTLGFELLLGRVILGYSWERLASDYQPSEGGLLPLGLLILTAAPLIAAKARGAIYGRCER